MGSNLGSVRSDPSLTRHMEALFPSLQETVDAAGAVASLRAHRGWPVLLSLLDAEVAAIDAKLDGAILEHVEYASLHGRRRGLRAHGDLIDALVARAESRVSKQRAKHEGAAEPVPGGIA